MKFPEYTWMEAKHKSSRRGREPTIIVLHYTAGKGDADALGRFFARGNREASAHFGVSREPEDNGVQIYQYVDTEDNAWHAGKSKFRGRGIVGWRSIGVEICNQGSAYSKDYDIYPGRHRNPASKAEKWEPYRWTQQKAIEELCAKLKKAHPTLKYITGHEDIRNNQVLPELKGSKTDPGPGFYWSTTDFGTLEQWHWSFKRKIWYQGNPVD